MLDIQNIPPYITIREGFDWYYYLTIHGGTGRKDGLGGQHTFYLSYLRPDQHAAMGEALDFWCMDHGMPCGVGDTIQKAYEDYIEKAKKLPFK